MALDPRITVMPDGSYFYSGSVLNCKGRLYRPAGYDRDIDSISSKRRSKPFIFEGQHIRDIGNVSKYTRVDTTVPRITFSKAKSRHFVKSPILSVEEIAKTIFLEWLLVPNRVEEISGSRQRGLIVDRGKRSFYPRYPHFEIAYSHRDTRQIYLNCWYSRTFNGRVIIQLLSNTEAAELADNLREEWEELEPEQEFPFYDQMRYTILRDRAGISRLVKLLRKNYVENIGGWHLIDGYHCAIIGYNRQM